MMDEEWGPWTEHDGKGCPCRGMLIEAMWLHRNGELDPVSETGEVIWIVPGEAGSDPLNSSWWWTLVDGRPECWDEGNAPIIRYRIRKPRALRELIDMIENLPVKEDA